MKLQLPAIESADPSRFLAIFLKGLDFVIEILFFLLTGYYYLHCGSAQGLFEAPQRCSQQQ
jgi:hypothetical protein